MRRAVTLATVFCLLLAASSSAQRGRANTSPVAPTAAKSIELGLDGRLSFGVGGQNDATVFELVQQIVRVGFHVTPQWSIEPSVGLARASDRAESQMGATLGIGALYHFSSSSAQRQLYARPFFNFMDARSTVQTSPTTTVTNSSNLTQIGAGLGVKLPWKERLAWRLETNYSHTSKQYIDDSDNRLGLVFGLSYLTR